MSPKAIWFITFVILLLLTGALTGYLTQKKIKHLHVVNASLMAITLFLGFQLLFALDSPNTSKSFRLIFSLVSGILGFVCYFPYYFAFMAFRKRFRNVAGLKDKNDKG